MVGPFAIAASHIRIGLIWKLAAKPSQGLGIVLVNIETLAVLGAGAGVAGFVDTLAGAAAWITVPLLLLTGLPPLQVLATNKLQGMFGTLSSTTVLLRKGQISVGEGPGGFVAPSSAASSGRWRSRSPTQPRSISSFLSSSPPSRSIFSLPRGQQRSAARRGLAGRPISVQLCRRSASTTAFWGRAPAPSSRSRASPCEASRCSRPRPLQKCSMLAAISALWFSFSSPEGGLGLRRDHDLRPNFGCDGRFACDDPRRRPADPAADRWRLLRDDPPLCLAAGLSACPLAP